MQQDQDIMWQEQSRRELLKTPVFTVTERKSLGPNGTEGLYIVNEARDWVIVIPVVEDSFLMVRQWRHGQKALSTEFPGGVIDFGESPEDGARRELKEETGASAQTLVYLGQMNPNPALFSNIFCAKDLTFSGTQHLDADEFLHSFKMKQEDVYARTGTEDFCHALMASALCLYRSRFGV